MDTVKIIFRNKEYEVPAGKTLCFSLEKLGINRESVLASRNGVLITDDEFLREEDVIHLIAVISGGERVVKEG